MVLATAALAGCSENTSSQLLVPASIHITSARLIDDTIDAAVGPMLVEVRDDHGHLVPGGVISISASDELLGTPVFWGSDPDMLPGGRPDTIRAHADGIARVYLRFNARIGNFFVYAAAGQSRDSIAVTIRPGKPFSFDLSPRDTAVYPGAAYPVAWRVYDRAHHATPYAVTLTTRRPEIASLDPNDSVHALATGRVYIVASAESARDSVALSVVPHGRILAFTRRYGSGDIAKFVMFELDGSQYRTLDTTSFAYNNRAQYFLPNGQKVVYHDVARDLLHCLWTMDTLGTVDTLFRPTGTIAGAAMPQPSRDGAWVYFSASMGYEKAEVWRITSDGQTPTRIGPVSTQGDIYGAASPSPDGSSLAVIVDRLALLQGVHLGVISVATGQFQLIAPAAPAPTLPRWSPVGDEIAYFGDKGLSVVRSDGQLLFGPVATPAGAGWDTADGQLDWSGDGKWLIACMTGASAGDRHIVVIDRATGEVLPIAFTARERLCGATWHP